MALAASKTKIPMVAGNSAIQLKLAASAAVPAQEIDENASANVATRDEVWRRRK